MKVMRFDEKPKRRSLHLKKSRVEISRESGSSRRKKSNKFENSFEAKSPLSQEELEQELSEGVPVFKREKPMKLPEGYDEDETFRESLTAAIKNHIPLVAAGVVALVAIGFFTGFIPSLFNHDNKDENTVSATAEPTEKTRTIFTQGKFNLSTENTDAGVDIICDTITDEDGNERKSCHAKTEEDRKKEEEEKEREEQEKKAKEEREKEEKEDKEAKEKKSKESSTPSTSSDSKTSKDTTPKTETPVKATGITSVSGCPAEAASGNIIVLKANVLPFNAENQNIIWTTTSSASVVYNSTGNTATVSVHSGEKVIVTAMTVDGGYTEHCVFPIVSELTE